MTRTAGRLHGVPVRKVRLPGLSVAVAELGDGPTVVFIPGYTGSKEDFGPLFPLLADAGLRAVAYDQRGQHESISDDPATDDYSPDGLGRDLLALLDLLETGPAHVVGHSFGGLVARAAFLARADAFADLVLIASGPASVPTWTGDPMRELKPILLDGGPEAVWPYVNSDGRATEFARERFLGQRPEMFVGMSEALLNEPDRVQALRIASATHQIPIAVLAGLDDDVWPPEVQRRMAHDLDATFVSIPGAAHSPPVEQPEKTVKALLAFYSMSSQRR